MKSLRLINCDMEGSSRRESIMQLKALWSDATASRNIYFRSGRARGIFYFYKKAAHGAVHQQCITFNFAHVFYRGELQLMGCDGAFIIRPQIIHARSNFKSLFKHVRWWGWFVGLGTRLCIEIFLIPSTFVRWAIPISCHKTSRFFQPTQPSNLPSVHVYKERADDAHPNELQSPERAQNVSMTKWTHKSDAIVCLHWRRNLGHQIRRPT